MPDNDSRAAYLSARKLGRKYLSEHERDEDKGLLPVLEDRLKDVKIMGEINLGYHEIPLDRIVGTRTAARSNSFAGNFMPLLADDTEFAVKWQKVYASQLVEGIREPISVYEYINRYYVLEGNKRVSILKCRCRLNLRQHNQAAARETVRTMKYQYIMSFLIMIRSSLLKTSGLTAGATLHV